MAVRKICRHKPFASLTSDEMTLEIQLATLRIPCAFCADYYAQTHIAGDDYGSVCWRCYEAYQRGLNEVTDGTT